MFWEIFGNHAGSESLIKVQQEINAGHDCEISKQELAVDTGKVISQKIVNSGVADKGALYGMPESAIKAFKSLF